MPIRFQRRELRTYAEFLTVEQLEYGAVYFDASFFDWNMLLPSLGPYVFIGKNIEPDAGSAIYFQDLESYRRGVRFETAKRGDGAVLVQAPEDNPGFYDYERALDQLIACYLRRTGVSDRRRMTFESRDLKLHPEPISIDQVEEGVVYFSLTYSDEDRFFPSLNPYVFIGRDLCPGDSGIFYFQDYGSHQEGVRLGAKIPEDDAAHFMEIKADESDHLFEYEAALEELMRCSVRRQKAGFVAPPRYSEAEDGLQGTSRTLNPGSLRLEDSDLQVHLISELRKSDLLFEVREDGAICADADWLPIWKIVRRIEESVLASPYYFFIWKKSRAAELFREAIRKDGIPYQLEHHEDKMIFLLPKGDEELHQNIAGRVMRSEFHKEWP